MNENKDSVTTDIYGMQDMYPEVEQLIDKSAAAKQKIRYDLITKEEKRQLLIRQNICPNCKGKLFRGKRDKRMSYKRAFFCHDKECKSVHYI